jgi:uncharacterized paraquat-inducible protein A
MCIICRDEYNGETTLYCGGCTSLTSLPPLPNVTHLYCNGCTSLTSLPDMPNVNYLDCGGCTLLTSLPEMPNVTELYCSGCTSLTSLPNLPKVTVLYCSWCRILTSLPVMTANSTISCHHCPWLNVITNQEYGNNNTKLLMLQRLYRRLRWYKYLTSREFIEWCYAPDNIGGKQAKKNLNSFVKSI